MRFLKIFAVCVLQLAALGAIAEQFTTMIPVLEAFTWPGAVISAGIFLMTGVNLFNQSAVFDTLALVFNGAILATVVVILGKLVRVVFAKSHDERLGEFRTRDDA